MEVLRGRDGRDGRDGEKGDTGSPGVQGERGVAGPRGPVGDNGARGDPGAKGEPGMQSPPAGGAVYTRWGRTTCPTCQGTQLLYAGRAGGTPYQYSGGAANYVCLPNDPDYLQYQTGVQGVTRIGGVVYQYGRFPSLSSLNSQNVPCAVCYVANRSVAVMIPAKTQCPTHWTLEYIGYLMTKSYHNAGPKMYECVDKDPESIPGPDIPSDVSVAFKPVEPFSSGISNTAYDDEKELTCVVCTR